MNNPDFVLLAAPGRQYKCTGAGRVMSRQLTSFAEYMDRVLREEMRDVMMARSVKIVLQNTEYEINQASNNKYSNTK